MSNVYTGVSQLLCTQCLDSGINAGNCQRPARCNVLVAKASRGVGVEVEHSTRPDTIYRPFRRRSSSQNYPASEPIILISLDHETRWTVSPSVCLYMSNLQRFTLLLWKFCSKPLPRYYRHSNTMQSSILLSSSGNIS